MTSGIKTSYNYMFSFIKEKGCELLEEEREIKVKETIKIKCSCGNIMKKCFDKIRNLDILLCPSCMGKIKSNNLKKPIEKVLSIIKKNEYIFLDGCYDGIGKRTLIIKDSKNYYYKVSLREIMNSEKTGGNLEKFSKSNPFTIDNIKNWIILEKRPFLYIDGLYKTALQSTLKFKCAKCSEFWIASWANISQLQGCPYCYGKKVGKENSFGKLFPELLKEWGDNKQSPFKIKPGSHVLVFWKCQDCKNIWKTSVNKRALGGTGCPKCNNSKGEKIISEYLLLNNIVYYPQHIFSDCRYKNPLRFDFYIPEYNCCIEYQGDQHYKPITFSKKDLEYYKKEFLENKNRDNIKKEWCKNTGIFLLEIPYWEFNNIKDILNNNLITN